MLVEVHLRADLVHGGERLALAGAVKQPHLEMLRSEPEQAVRLDGGVVDLHDAGAAGLALLDE